jgi:glycerol-3-phosphate O-acyltransferase 3/4
MHLFNLMTSWTVVCDVWYLEPQEQLPGESPIQFACACLRVFSLPPPCKLVLTRPQLAFSASSPGVRGCRLWIGMAT